MYIYIYVHIRNVDTYIYIYMCICLYIYIYGYISYICIYICGFGSRPPWNPPCSFNRPSRNRVCEMVVEFRDFIHHCRRQGMSKCAWAGYCNNGHRVIFFNVDPSQACVDSIQSRVACPPYLDVNANLWNPRSPLPLQPA